MKLLLMLALGMAVLGVEAATSSRGTVNESANRYLDKLLKNLQDYMKRSGLDPITIPDQVAKFEKKILLVTYSGSARLTDGRLHGLSTIYRYGKAKVDMRSRKRLIIESQFVMSNLWGSIDAAAEFMDIGVNARGGIAVDSILVNVKISADLSSGSAPKLEKFYISKMSDIVVRFKGLGPLDWIINPVTNFLVNSVGTILKYAIEFTLRKELQNLLGEIEVPKEVINWAN